MHENLICPFCNSSIPNTDDTYRKIECYFNCKTPHFVDDLLKVNSNIFDICMLHCPSCDEVSFIAKGRVFLEGKEVLIYPTSSAKQFPEYIPQTIREDYEEAYSILNLSPKASATLSRRCLQGMIRDFWKISKNTLYEEISELKDKIAPSQWKAIDATRSIGNIGAHMEKDVNTIVDIEPNEAEQLIKLIELLIDKWYIARHDEEELCKSIVSIKDAKVKDKSMKES